MRNNTYKQKEIEDEKTRLRAQKEQVNKTKRRLKQLKNQQQIQKDLELDR